MAQSAAAASAGKDTAVVSKKKKAVKPSKAVNKSASKAKSGIRKQEAEKGATKQNKSAATMSKKAGEKSDSTAMNEGRKAQSPKEKLGGAIGKVGKKIPTGAPKKGVTSPQSNPEVPTGILNINSATRKQLIALPGIGERLADRILAYRTAKGKISSLEELRKIEGIGPATIEKLKNSITF